MKENARIQGILPYVGGCRQMSYSQRQNSLQLNNICREAHFVFI